MPVWTKFAESHQFVVGHCLRVRGRSNGRALRKSTFRRPVHGFTLVELLVVITISITTCPVAVSARSKSSRIPGGSRRVPARQSFETPAGD